MFSIKNWLWIAQKDYLLFRDVHVKRFTSLKYLMIFQCDIFNYAIFFNCGHFELKYRLDKRGREKSVSKKLKWGIFHHFHSFLFIQLFGNFPLFKPVIKTAMKKGALFWFQGYFHTRP